MSWSVTTHCPTLISPRFGVAAAITTGYALMLCYLRFPGRALRVSERPLGPLLVFVADQIETLPDCIGEYLVTDLRALVMHSSP